VVVFSSEIIRNCSYSELVDLITEARPPNFCSSEVAKKNIGYEITEKQWNQRASALSRTTLKILDINAYLGA